MNKIIGWFKVEAHRAYIYNVMIAAGALLLGYGILTAVQVALWIGLGGSLLGNVLARGNTTTKTVGGTK